MRTPAFKIKHIYGPKTLNYSKNELVVFCLVRDGQLHIRPFIQHYFALGVKHIVFLDNMSVDKTVPIACSYRNVSVLQTGLSFQRNKQRMRRYLLNRFSKGRWGLCVDIDELFDYPFSNKVNLSSFLAYLNKHSYTAVVAQMLDLFSDKPLSGLKNKTNDNIRELYRYYDIANIKKASFRGNIISNKNIHRHSGGIHGIIFGLDRITLTKHPLVFIDDKINLFTGSSHRHRNARIADLSCVLYHYKLIGNFYEKAMQVAKRENYWRNSYEYKIYFNLLKKNPDLIIKQKTSLKLNGIKDLIDRNFLVVSEDYMRWVESRKNKKE